VGPLMKAWGFFRGQGRVPSSAELKEVLKHVGYQHVKLDPARRTIHFDVPGIELDLGGIAKGYAVDLAVRVLRDNGITSAFVSSGMSSIYALGAPPGEKGWKITLRDPFDEKKAADVAYLKNYSMSVSGNYNKFFKLGGKMYSHIMDPHTGMPVEGMLSTTVFVATGTDSDALSKLYVLGVKGSRRYLATHSDIEALFYVPTGVERQFARVSLRSPSYHLPPDALLEVQGREEPRQFGPQQLPGDKTPRGERAAQCFLGAEAESRVRSEGIGQHTCVNRGNHSASGPARSSTKAWSVEQPRFRIPETTSTRSLGTGLVITNRAALLFQF
jgi:ApbE family protein